MAGRSVYGWGLVHGEREASTSVRLFVQALLVLMKGETLHKRTERKGNYCETCGPNQTGVVLLTGTGAGRTLSSFDKLGLNRPSSPVRRDACFSYKL